MDDSQGIAAASRGHATRSSPSIIFAPDDAQRRHELRNKRRLALGLLIAMAGGFLLTFLARAPGFWTMLARHSIEAGLAGELADWFAVTALFRRPLGLPIPYTGIVEEQKDQLGRSVGAFVERNFLSSTLIVARVRSIDPARRLAEWLTGDDNAHRLAERIVARLPAIMATLEDRDLRHLIARMMGDELGKIDIAPVLGGALRVLGSSQEAEVLFDRLLDGLLDVVFDNAERIQLAVERQNAWWMPRAFDRRLTNAILAGIEDFVADLRVPDSAGRVAMRTGIVQIATGLVESAEQRTQVEALKRRLINDPDIQAWLHSIWQQLRDAAIAGVASGETRCSRPPGIASLLEGCGRTLHTDAELRRHVDEFVAGAAQKAVVLLRGEIGGYIADVVQGWDARTIADRMELTIGANLQFIRINGTLVGALAGCCLFLLSCLLS